MRTARAISTLTLLLIGVASPLALAQVADEPFQPTVTLQELGQQCAGGIGRYHVELQIALLKEAKYQSEIERLRKLIPKQEPEKK